MTLTVNVGPNPNLDRIIKIHYLGALKKGFLVDDEGEVLKDSYILAKGDSIFTLKLSMLEDSINSINEGLSGAIETEIEKCSSDTSAWFNLYAHPSYNNTFIKTYIRKDNTVDFGITGGTPNLMRSINGGLWHNAYLPLTTAEQLSVTDGANIWLREPNGCWETELFFTTYTNPTILRYVNIQKAEGVTTVPGAGKQPVETHKDFTFTASYDGSLPLKVTTQGLYSGTYKELLGEDMKNGTYKYTIRSVVEPINITFGPDIASGIVKNESIETTHVWTFNDALNIHSEANITVNIYNISGTLYKRLTTTEDDTKTTLPRGIYIVTINDTRYKVIIK